MARTKGGNRLDDAARAGWLYYVAGNTQDEIAHKLGVSDRLNVYLEPMNDVGPPGASSDGSPRRGRSRRRA